MTQHDIDIMLNELRATTRYLQETARLTRATAEHVAAVADNVTTISEHSLKTIAHIDAAITAALIHLHGEEEAPE